MHSKENKKQDLKLTMRRPLNLIIGLAVLFVNCKKAGPEVQAPGKTLLHLTQGQKYKISFMAKADEGGGQNKVFLKDANNLETTYYESDLIDLSSQVNTYTRYYTHTAATEMDARFEFDIGAKKQTLLLDKVELIRDSDYSYPVLLK